MIHAFKHLTFKVYDSYMARKKAPEQVCVAELQPDEINALREVVKEFITRMTNIENEITLLGEDKKELVEEFKQKLDVKTLNAAMKVMKIQKGVQHRDTYDLFIEVLEEPAV